MTDVFLTSAHQLTAELLSVFFKCHGRWRRYRAKPALKKSLRLGRNNAIDSVVP